MVLSGNLALKGRKLIKTTLLIMVKTGARCTRRKKQTDFMESGNKYHLKYGAPATWQRLQMSAAQSL